MTPVLLVLLLTVPSRITVPQDPAALIARHLAAIEQAHWAHVVPGDLYHAHLLLSPVMRDRKALSSPDELFASAVAILYHSDEQLRRWRLEDGDLPTERKRPRSIIGYPDGSIVSAASLFPDPARSAPHYERHGTIHSDDLAREFPERFLERRDWNLGGCTVNLIVDIFRRHEDGKLQLTMECARR